MQISSRFTIAIHIFACIDTFEKDYKVTSDLIASSVNANPVVIRRILSSLKKSGLIHVQRGTGGGTEIAKPLNQITLYDIFQSVECVDGGELFHFHENPNTKCPDEIQKFLTNKWGSWTNKKTIVRLEKYCDMCHYKYSFLKIRLIILI